MQDLALEIWEDFSCGDLTCRFAVLTLQEVRLAAAWQSAVFVLEDKQSSFV